MAVPISKRELLERLSAERECWEKLVSQVSMNLIDEDSIAGGWSVQDVVAHLTAWEREPVAWLEAIRTGTAPWPPAWPTSLSEPEINAWLCALNRGRTWRDVRTESREVFARLVQLLRHAPEDALVARDRFEWLNGKSLAESIAGDTFEHYQDHARALQAWLQQTK